MSAGKLRVKRARLQLFRKIFLMMLTQATKPMIGGQAVIEGVMMRSPKSFAIAVRKPDGRIVVREDLWLSFSARFPILKWPILRGASMLIESMYNGIGALNFSAQEAMEEMESQEQDSQTIEIKENIEKENEKESSLGIWIAIASSMLFGVLVFKGIPHLLTWGIGEWLGSGSDNALPIDSVWFHLVDGGIRLSMFVGYILLISMFDDVKRLFMYHGAEHMSVHAYEADVELNVENTRTRSTAHPRCGTTLILLVMAVSIAVFAVIIPLLPRVSDNDLLQNLFAFGFKVPLMLPVAGLSYELQRRAAKNPGQFWVQFLITPGMLMQKLTTAQPTDRELEVALTALKKALWREENSEEAESKENIEFSELTDTSNIEYFSDFKDVEQKIVNQKAA